MYLGVATIEEVLIEAAVADFIDEAVDEAKVSFAWCRCIASISSETIRSRILPASPAYIPVPDLSSLEFVSSELSLLARVC